jgi:NitT/TauT family transport system ATP-binding protein
MSRSVPLLRAVDVSFLYPGSREYTLKNLNLEVREREIVVLLGKSGCGKTSLLGLLGCLLPVKTGQVSFRGRTILTPQPEISVVFQDACLLPWLNVADNVGLALSFRSLRVPAEERKKRVREALREVGLRDEGEKYPAQLSGGMDHRTALARSLVRQAELLLLDEPFSSLDAVTRRTIQELLLNLIRAHRSSALLVTHDLDEAMFLADRLLLMDRSGGSHGLEELDLNRLLGADRGDEAGRGRRSALFMNLREEISAKLAGEG